ncbi:E3 ubiquitin-protein ligase TRIM33-like [Dreissena polymorpha]|uniref:E3 ubiquitin-protein ligase TRIM33-like n=1 Tax=Dreissena polymorpha TaxID=45954 RepID=UPI002263F525|nr:E3 ubiquitin-protein ligase TRIM33-like [Dreissena polymorpha]
MADNVSIKSVKSDASGKTSISSNSRPSTQKSQTSKVKRRRRKSSVSSVGNGAKPKKDGGGIFEQTAIPEEEKLPLELCGACQREARHVEATHFCEECSENLCATCVQQHRKFPLMKDHVIKPRGGATAVKTVAMTTCEKHDGKALDMYCFDHDVVNCAACIAINHRKCKKVTYLPVAAKDIAQTEEYKDVIVTMETLRVELATSRVRRNEDNIRLSKEKDDAVHRVKYIRKQINKCLDKLEEKTLEVLQNQFREYNARIQHDIDTCNEIIATLARITSELSPATVMDDSQRFITMRQGKSTALKAKNTIATLHEMKGTEQIQFLPDPRITDLVKSLPSLGSFASEQRLLTATLVAQFDVHLANDVSECQILGSAFLPDGKAILADWENKKVKLLNQSFKAR